MDSVRILLSDWIAKEPIASLWLVVVSILLFGMTIARSRGADDSILAWRRRLVDALSRTLVFLGLAAMFYILLSSSYASFGHIYGSIWVDDSVSNQHWQEWQRLYGGTCVQSDLQVRQYITVETQEVIEPADASLPVLYRNIKIEQPVPQNSISRFNGRVTIDTADVSGQVEAFNGYTLTAAYEYRIVNPTQTETRIEFRLPLSPETKLFRDISIKMDGQEISSRRVAEGAISWEGRMSSGQKRDISIRYSAQGMDRFHFEVPEPREVTDFQLEVAVRAGDIWPVTEPENGGIRVNTRQEPPYQIITWSIDHAIMNPRLGVALWQMWPYDPYHNPVVILAYAARALVFFLSITVLTLLICNASVRLRQMALLASLFALPFLLLMASDFVRPASLTPAQFADWQVWALPVLSVLSLRLAYITLRKLPRLPLVLLLVIMVVFIDGYVYVGLVPDEQKRNAAESMVQVGMIAYVVLLTLFIRVRSLVQARRRPAG